jgi:tRNA-dihydrouridine synthase B
VGAIVERVVRACAPTPVTAKIRLGCTRSTVNAIEVAQVIEQAGAAALTVHGRTAADFFSGSADWEQISAIKPHLRRIPLIGNGDLGSVDAVLAAFERYAVDGVMIARAALGRPWLFRQCAAALRGEPIPTGPVRAPKARDSRARESAPAQCRSAREFRDDRLVVLFPARSERANRFVPDSLTRL